MSAGRANGASMELRRSAPTANRWTRRRTRRSRVAASILFELVDHHLSHQEEFQHQQQQDQQQQQHTQHHQQAQYLLNLQLQREGQQQLRLETVRVEISQCWHHLPEIPRHPFPRMFWAVRLKEHLQNMAGNTAPMQAPKILLLHIQSRDLPGRL